MSEPDAVPLPREGEVFFDVRGEARCMRLSWYADSAIAVFSIWQGSRCTGTFRLPFKDLDRMARALQSGPGEPAVTGQPDDGYLDRDQAPGYSGVHGHHDSRAGQHHGAADRAAAAYATGPFSPPDYDPPNGDSPWRAGAAAAQPGYPAEPRYAEPRYAEPRYAEPRYAEPRYAEPRYAEPRYAEPRYAEPGYPAEPRYAGQGHPDEAGRHADQGYPDQGYPDQGYPGQGYPGPDLADPGYPAEPWHGASGERAEGGYRADQGYPLERYHAAPAGRSAGPGYPRSERMGSFAPGPDANADAAGLRAASAVYTGHVTAMTAPVAPSAGWGADDGDAASDWIAAGYPHEPR